MNTLSNGEERAMVFRPLLPCVALLSLALPGCADDPLYAFCTDNGDGFDIDEVSALEGNLGWKGTADAVVLRYDDDRLAKDDANSWRVVGVDVLVMIARADFDRYDDSAKLEVLVFDGDDLNDTTPYRLRQRLVASDLDWTTYSFDTPPEGAHVVDEFGLPAPNFETEYVKAWWHFDFTGVIPEEGMTNTTYAVGLFWPDDAAPLVGYSLYDRSCADNWTNYDEADPAFPDDGVTGWASNEDRATTGGCNWPMLKVNTELRSTCQK
jgi:hypothetical protein